MTRYDVVNFISHGITKIENFSYTENLDTSTETKKKSEKTTLDTYCVDLIQKASQEKIDKLIGRDEEINRLTEILCRRTKNNPLLVGDPGVGKTAIVEGLANKIYKKEVPEILNGCKIFFTRYGFTNCWYKISR